MSQASSPPSCQQGFGSPANERLPMPPLEALDAAQRAAAQALIDGPRKGVYGPFLPLLCNPALLERVARLGECLRYEGALDARIRELCICAAARHVGNQFEWLMHQPLALKAGVSEAALQALHVGARPRTLAPDEEIALDFAQELLRNHGVSDPSFERACAQFGQAGTVELTTLLGYFVMVSWLMNVARTPAQAGAQGPALSAFPQ